MCRVYEVTRAGYYAWCSRERSEREHQNAQLAERIRVVHRDSRGTYGSPRVYQVLRKAGCRVGKNRVARVMRIHGIKARVARMRYTNPALQRYFATTRNEQLDVDLSSPDQVTDNAHIESFFHSMKTDIVHGLVCTEDRQIESAVRGYVPFYNGIRLHSSLNYVSPATYEKQMA